MKKIKDDIQGYTMVEERLLLKVSELVEGHNEITRRFDLHLRHHTEDAIRKI